VQPATAVLSVRRWNDNKGFGANRFDDSQAGNKKRQMQPTEIIATIRRLLHPFSALAATVRGIKINARAAESSNTPNTSKSNQISRIKFFRPPRRFGFVRIKFSFLAFLCLESKDKPSGRKADGRIIAHMPYPHRQDVCLRIADAIMGPIQTVTRNGSCGKSVNNARFSKSLLSAMKTC
jgi:hypothetical protein